MSTRRQAIGKGRRIRAQADNRAPKVDSRAAPGKDWSPGNPAEMLLGASVRRRVEAGGPCGPPPLLQGRGGAPSGRPTCSSSRFGPTATATTPRAHRPAMRSARAQRRPHVPHLDAARGPLGRQAVQVRGGGASRGGEGRGGDVPSRQGAGRGLRGRGGASEGAAPAESPRGVSSCMHLRVGL